MVTYVKLPKLTLTMEEGTIGKWLKNEGEKVEKGEAICEVETEKTTDEIEAPSDGVFRKIIVSAGSTAKVNQVIAIITNPNESIPDLKGIVDVKEKGEVVQKVEIKKKTGEKEQIIETEVIGEKKRIKASPVAKRLAESKGIDLNTVQGTGPEGRIIREDIIKAIETVEEQPMFQVERVIPLTGIRKIIADRLGLSAKNALNVPLTMEVDMSEIAKILNEIRREIEEKTKIHISYTDILVKAVAKALEEHPIMNAIIENEEIKIIKNINVGVAVALKDGLIVPVIHNANEKSLNEISKNLRQLIEKAREGTLATKEATGGTFTISNLGMFGIDLFAPIINPPETAILGVGRIIKKPILIEDKIALRSMMTLTLVFDHRARDGAVAASFLKKIKVNLENPHAYIMNF